MVDSVKVKRSIVECKCGRFNNLKRREKCRLCGYPLADLNFFAFLAKLKNDLPDNVRRELWPVKTVVAVDYSKADVVVFHYEDGSFYELRSEALKIERKGGE